MKAKNDTDKIISELLAAPFTRSLTDRERYFFRESLRSLVRLAKSEQVMEIKLNVRRLTAPASRSASKGSRHGDAMEHAQRQFEFN